MICGLVPKKLLTFVVTMFGDGEKMLDMGKVFSIKFGIVIVIIIINILFANCEIMCLIHSKLIGFGYFAINL